MSVLQKVLDTDKFSDLVTKVNSTVDTVESLKYVVNNAYRSIQKNQETIEKSPTVVTETSPEEMNYYLKSLYP